MNMIKPFRGTPLLFIVLTAVGVVGTRVACPAQSVMDDAIRVVLAPKQVALISAQVTGAVGRVALAMGETFDTGATLIELDDTVFRANRRKVVAQLERARALLSAKQKLFIDDASSVFEVEDAKAAVAIADAQLEIAEKELAFCRIVAPFAGRLVAYHVNEHEFVQPGQKLVEIVNDGILHAQFLMPSRQIRLVKIGQAVEIVINETDARVAGVITRIGAIVDPSSSTVKVVAEIRNTGGNLRSGMSGRIVGGVLPK